jgi:hypothetical protein
MVGVAVGLLGAVMMAILCNVQYAAFGYHEGSLQYGMEQAPAPAAERPLIQCR